jgi:capsular exopolysaccharide synthesis family protein
LFVLNAMRRWWKVAAPIGILLAVASAGTIFFFFKKTYVAVGRIQIFDQPINIAFPTTESANKKFVQTQLARIKFPEVLNPVLRDPEIQLHREILAQGDFALEYLMEKITVKPEGESEYYTITYESEDAQLAARIVNAVIDSYMTYIASVDADFRHRLTKLLGNATGKWQSKVELLSSQVQSLCETKGIRPSPTIVGTGPGASADDSVLSMEALLIQSEVDIVLLKAEIESEQALTGAPADVDQRSINHAVATELADRKTELAKMKRQLETLEATKSGKSNPLYQKELFRYQEAEKQLAEWEEQRLNDAKSQLSLNADSRLNDLRSQLALAQTTKKIVEERLKNAAQDEKVVIGDQFKVDFLNRQLQQADSIYNRLLEQEARLSTEEGAPSRVFAPSGPGGVPVPGRPVKPYPLKEMLLAAFLSLAAPLGLAVGWELTVKRVNSVNDIRTQMGMPILGEIAVLPTYTSGRRVSRKAQLGRHLFQESVDGFRTKLMLANSMESLQVLAVASAVSGEGKTSVATHLAMSLAHTTGKPILLIDGDLRAPDVHHVFDVVRGPGLAEVLTGEAPLENAVARSGFAQLDILPAGELTSNPHRLLHNGELRALLESVRQKYAYILIDMPPVLAASESLVLANQADGTVLCVMRDRTRLSTLQEAQSRLADAGAKTIGIVVSGLPIRHYSSRYDNYAYGTSVE